MRRVLVVLAVIVAAVLIWAVASGALDRAILAVRLIDDLRRPNEVSWLDRATPEPQARAITIAAGEGIEADLYVVPESRDPMPFVFVPGAVAQGKDDPRVAPFARLLAQAGFRVIVPDLSSLRRLDVHPDDLEQLIEVADAIASNPDLAPRGRIGMFGVSYSGGLAVLAALDSRLRDRLQFVATLGAYADLDTMIRFLADGRLVRSGRIQQLSPDPYARMVVAKTLQSFLERAEDRALIDKMIERRADDRHATIEDLAERLSDESRVIYDLFERARPDEVAALMARLPPGMRAHSATLSPARHDFGRLGARLYLAHDERDGTIPFTESLRLADLARPHQPVRLLVLDTVRHVAPEPWQKDVRGFLTRDLPQATRMASWWWHLLAERTRSD